MTVGEFLKIIEFSNNGCQSILIQDTNCCEVAKFYQPCKMLDSIKNEKIENLSASGTDSFTLWLAEEIK